MSNDKGSSFFSGFFLGGIIGVIAALFLLQKNGKEPLKSRFLDLVEMGRKTIEEAIVEGKEAASKKESHIRGEADLDDC